MNPTVGKVVVSLNELLEAERAGARVAWQSARETDDPKLNSLLMQVHADELKWCRLLGSAIETLGGTKSPRTGSFYEQAMAMTNRPERMEFLNRGQRWVVKRLERLLPDIEDEALRADLGHMLEAHERNIEHLARTIGAPPEVPNRTVLQRPG